MSDLEIIGASFSVVFVFGILDYLLFRLHKNTNNRIISKITETAYVLLFVVLVFPAIGVLILSTLRYIASLLP